jgi:hypothetical protein
MEVDVANLELYVWMGSDDLRGGRGGKLDLQIVDPSSVLVNWYDVLTERGLPGEEATTGSTMSH